MPSLGFEHTLLILGVIILPIQEDVWGEVYLSQHLQSFLLSRCSDNSSHHSFGLRYAFPVYGLVQSLDAMANAVCTQALLCYVTQCSLMHLEG